MGRESNATRIVFAAILKVAQLPTSTATYPQLQATAVLPMLAPAKSRTVDDRPMR